MPELDLGLVVGPQGPKGKTGNTGPAGPEGPAGAQGPAGKSAYETAVEGGYTGTEEQFTAALLGVDSFVTGEFVTKEYVEGMLGDINAVMDAVAGEVV